MGDNKTKGLLGIVVTALIGALLLFSLFRSVNTEKNLRLEKERELQAKIEELARKDVELAELHKQKTDLETEMKAMMGSAEAAARELEAKIAALNENVEALVKDNEFLSKERDMSLTKITELNRRIQDLEAEKYDLVTKIRVLQESVPAEPLAQATGLGGGPSAAPQETVELGQIVVQKSSGKAAQVQQVDTVYGFIVVNAGSKDGIKKDAVLNITRGNTLVAKAVVEKLRDNVSAAVILPEWAQGEVRVGDTVTQP